MRAVRCSPERAGHRRPFRIVGAHTDSPNLRVKQHPDRVVAGWQVVALQPYGGRGCTPGWTETRLSGRLSVRDPDAEGGVRQSWSASTNRCFGCRSWPSISPRTEPQSGSTRSATSTPSGVPAAGHVPPMTTSPSGPAGAAGSAGGRPDDPRPLAVAGVIGAQGDLVSAPRLDNQGTCYAGMEALLAAEPGGYLPVLVLFDHEEVGFVLRPRGTVGFLLTTLERIVLAGAGTGRTS